MSDLPAIALPRAPEPPAPFRFPLVATLAPVIVSVALWLITGSIFALLFAALGPVTAVASVVDSRLGSRRSGRRERVRFLAEAETARAAIRDRHALEAALLDEQTPDAAAIVARRGADPARWANSRAVVTLGRGRRASASALPTRTPPARADAEIEGVFDELEAIAASLHGVPVAVDAALGIGIVGSHALGLATARSLAVQLAWALSPAHHWCARLPPGDPEQEWIGQLPHRTGPTVSDHHRFAFGVAGETQPLAAIAVASHASELPGSCRVVVRVGGDAQTTILQHPERAARQTVETAFVSREEAVLWAIDAARDATRHGLAEPHSTVPPAAALTSLLGAVDSDGPPGLAARVALSARGPFVLDLVAHGPHAVVGGTTGSGKSELLIAWVLGMAAAHPPERVTFLLVDFKGGSAFGSLAALPHTVGTITDLDARGAARALASLRAELSYRERTLAAAFARSIDECPSLPRLVIVVDEFAAMLTDHPDLHALFADLAARGRSLGVHLILCTQRPAGVVRDGVLANADLRVSLRVNNVGDSSAVVGSDAAALIPADARGRAIVRLSGADPELVQFALATDADARTVAALWPSAARARRPWMEPLPALITGVPPAGDGTAFGVLDIPAEQRWATAVWRERDSHVLVLGAPGTGKSTALRALGGASPMLIPESVDAAWDAVADLAAVLDSVDDGSLRKTLDDPGHITVVIDDLDALLARFGPDHRAVVVERLVRVLREGGGRGIRVATSAQRVAGELQTLAGLVPSRLWLRHASRHDLALAGGDGATHDDGMPPGGGHWQGLRLQVLHTAPPAVPVRAPRETLVPARAPLAIVSGRAGWLAPQLARHRSVTELAAITGDARQVFAADPTAVLIGDVEDWQSRWGALAAVRPIASILFHGCTATDFRALTRSRELPPPPSSDPAMCWQLEPDGSATRARLPL